MCESTVHEYQKCGCVNKERSLCKKQRCKPTVVRRKHPQKCPDCRHKAPTQASSKPDLDKEYARKSRMEEIDNTTAFLKAKLKYMRRGSSDAGSMISRSSASSRDSTPSDYVPSNFDDELTPSDSVTSIGSRPLRPHHTSNPTRHIDIVIERGDYANAGTLVEREDYRGRRQPKHRPPPTEYSDESEYSSRSSKPSKRPPPPTEYRSSASSSYTNSTSSRSNDARSQRSYATTSTRPSSRGTSSRSRTPPPPPPSDLPPGWTYDHIRQVAIPPPNLLTEQGKRSTVRGIDKRGYLICAPSWAPEGVD